MCYMCACTYAYVMFLHVHAWKIFMPFVNAGAGQKLLYPVGCGIARVSAGLHSCRRNGIVPVWQLVSLLDATFAPAGAATMLAFFPPF